MSKSLTMPEWIEPMKATLTDQRFSSTDWQFEPKLDGVRCLCYSQKGDVRLFSRRRLSMNETYPEIIDALKKQPRASFIADGEIVAFRPHTTITGFDVLQQRIGIHQAEEARKSPVKVYLYLFDLLYANDRDLRSLPLNERQAALKRMIVFDQTLRLTPHNVGEGERYYTAACRQGWEGLIAKRRGSRYQSGRSHDWLKFKCVKEQEFVIGGYTDPEGARDYFGALLVGYYRNNELVYAGKVGTGFNAAVLAQLNESLKALEQKQSSFVSVDLSRRGLHWVKPTLVAQIGFAEWTPDGKLRQGRFLGLRNDKPAGEVLREEPVALR